MEGGNYLRKKEVVIGNAPLHILYAIILIDKINTTQSFTHRMGIPCLLYDFHIMLRFYMYIQLFNGFIKKDYYCTNG